MYWINTKVIWHAFGDAAIVYVMFYFVSLICDIINIDYYSSLYQQAWFNSLAATFEIIFFTYGAVMNAKYRWVYVICANFILLLMTLQDERYTLSIKTLYP